MNNTESATDSAPLDANTPVMGASTPEKAIDASASAGTDESTKNAEILSAPAHPHHNLVHGAVVAVEALVRQLEAAVSEDCRDAIEHLHSAISRLKQKLETTFKNPE